MQAQSSRAKIVPPRSHVGAITPEQRKQIIDSSVLAGHFEQAVDRESAYEKLQARAGEKAETAGAPPVAAAALPITAGAPAAEGTQSSILAEALGTVTAAFQPTIGSRGAIHDSLATSMAKSAMRAASSQLGRQVVRGILGGILGGSGRRSYNQEIAGCILHIRRSESFFVYFFGEAAGLGASFLAPLPAFTSTSVADMV